MQGQCSMPLGGFVESDGDWQKKVPVALVGLNQWQNELWVLSHCKVCKHSLGFIREIYNHKHGNM